MEKSDQTPKKYIRTYAGDMEILKKGGTPDLKPLVPPPALPPVHVPPPVSIPIPKPSPIPTIAEPPAPLAPPPSVPTPEFIKPSPIQTYASDFSQRMKESRASTATILAAEQDAAVGAPHGVEEKPSRRDIFSAIAGVVLLLVGGAGASIAYTRYLAKVAPVNIVPTVAAPIFVNEREQIEGVTPAAIRDAINQSMARTLAPNTVRLLYTVSSTTSSTTSPQITEQSVFSALQLPAPGSLLRNVNAERSMAGIVSTGGGSASGGNTQSPFFILSVASYGDTFAGMLSWEPTMPRDLIELYPFFAEDSGEQTASSTAATTTSTAIFSIFFHDEVISNHDARVYRDAAGRSILLYGYWNQTTLVIARDPAAFGEILERLATSRAQ